MYNLAASSLAHFFLGAFCFTSCAAKDFLAQRKHVQVQLGEQRNVQEHHDPQEIEVGEGEIPRIWHRHRPHLRFTDMLLRPVEAKQFTGYTNGIQDDKECVTEIEKKRWLNLEKCS